MTSYPMICLRDFPTLVSGTTLPRLQCDYATNGLNCSSNSKVQAISLKYLTNQDKAYILDYSTVPSRTFSGTHMKTILTACAQSSVESCEVVLLQSSFSLQRLRNQQCIKSQWCPGHKLLKERSEPEVGFFKCRQCR
ncbi:hypothetical protein HAX54_014794 [Datura stramonium]|uniref:Uncharacterized protein n=1 Tax=Datura stramonium TaxID=4076 RepID=A0ABS8TNM3_DATST|nr:hypothetical protein [Datura stramonium]